MSDNKNYYYLKLKDNFFDSDEIKILEKMPNGYKYSNILLKLYLKSLKFSGALRLNEYIPYNIEMIAALTGHDIDTVRVSVQTFESLKLIEILENGTIYMLDIQSLIGKSSTEADRKKTYRLKIENEKKLLGSGQMSDVCPKSLDKNPPEIEIELEIDKEIELEIDIEKEVPAVPYEEIKNLYNSICKSLSQVRSLSSIRKKHIKARWEQFKGDINTFKNAFELIESSAFCRGSNNTNWKADLDWIICNDNNIIKVLEGKYEDKSQNSKGNSKGLWNGYENKVTMKDIEKSISEDETVEVDMEESIAFRERLNAMRNGEEF